MASSPYFSKRRRIECSPDSNSPRRSPYFHFSELDSFAPFLACLQGGEAPCAAKPYHESSLCAISCVSHFQSCSVFWERWKTGQECNQKLDEQRLHVAVRHLCSQGCYLRAYAPIREWYFLRKAAQARTDKAVGPQLAGWRCQLVPHDDLPHLPRALFKHVDGHCGTKSHMLAQLELKVVEDKESFLRRRSLCRPRGARGAEPTAPSWKSLPDVKSSPLGLLEELFVNDPWKLLLSTILLNRTTRRQVDPVLYNFLQRWPTPHDVLAAPLQDVCEVVRPLGMWYKRATGIFRFCAEFLALLESRNNEGDKASKSVLAHRLTRTDVKGLYYCGDYAFAAYQLFILGEWELVRTEDSALVAYTEFLRMRSAETNRRVKTEIL